MDLRYSCILFTWRNRRFTRQDFIEKKLDTALINQTWLDLYPMSHATFMAPGVSDHSPVIVDLGTQYRKKGLPFKFCNDLCEMDNFDKVVEKNWNKAFEGTLQFQLYHKLMKLKTALKSFAKNTFRKEKLNMDNARVALMDCQTRIDLNPYDMIFGAQDRILMTDFLDKLSI